MSKHIRPLSVTLYPIAPFCNKYKSIQREEEEERLVAFSRLGLSLVWPRPCLGSVTSSCQVGCKKSGPGEVRVVHGRETIRAMWMPSDRDNIYVHHGNHENANLRTPRTMRKVKTKINCVWLEGRRMDWGWHQQPKHDIKMLFGWNTLEILESFGDKCKFLKENFVWWGEW